MGLGIGTGVRTLVEPAAEPPPAPKERPDVQVARPILLGMPFVLTAVGAALAVALELFEAMAIVLAVALSRRPSAALAGAGAATLACAALAVVVGPVLVARVAGDALRVVVGVALLLFGMEWLRKGVLRLAGRRARSDSYAEFVAEREALAEDEPPVAGRFDWPGFVVAFKGVLLEGVEVILIVTVLAARPGGLAPALAGAAAAVVLVMGLGLLLHRPLRRLPESELKYVVGLVLTTFGTFFCAEGLGVDWPLGDAGLLVVLAVWIVVSQAMVRALSAAPRRAGEPRAVA
jgi:uncharacterized membrane protein